MEKCGAMTKEQYFPNFESYVGRKRVLLPWLHSTVLALTLYDFQQSPKYSDAQRNVFPHGQNRDDTSAQSDTRLLKRSQGAGQR